MDVLQAVNGAYQTGLPFDYDDAGFESLRKHGTTLRDELLERARTYDAMILGPQPHAYYLSPEKGGRNIWAPHCAKPVMRWRRR